MEVVAVRLDGRGSTVIVATKRQGRAGAAVAAPEFEFNPLAVCLRIFLSDKG